MSESLQRFITNLVTRAMRDPNPLLAPTTGGGDVPGALTNLDQKATDLDTAGDIVEWLGRADAWNDALQNVADNAFAGAEPLDSLIVRTIQSTMPRLGSFLAVAGVITSTPDGGQKFDVGRFFELLTSADTLISEAYWDALLGDDVGPGAGRRVAVLVALLLLFPDTVFALADDDLTVSPLPAPQADQPGTWADFLANTEQWLSLTFPLGDPTQPSPYPDEVYDFVSGIQADFTATIAGRSRRANVAGGRRTDFELWLALSTARNRWELDLGNNWILRVEPGITVGFGRVEDDWHGAFRAFTTDPAIMPGPGDPVRAEIRRDPGPDVPDILFGPPYDSRIAVHDVLLYLEVREDHPIAEVGLALEGFQFVLANRWFRLFGITDEIFREGIRYTGDLALAYVEGEGFRFNLSSALDVLFVIPKSVGQWGSDAWHLRWHSVRLRVPLEAGAGEFRGRIEITFHTSVQASEYVTFVLDGFGMWFGSWKDPLGDPAAERTSFGGLPPTGGGVQLEFPAVTAGGYFSRTELPDGGERWAGALTVRIQSFGVTAFGIYEKSGAGDSSFLVILGVRFGLPGIQLFAGFAITGIGGILGIDRRIDADALLERLTSGAAGNVLFLDDPIRNAPTIIGDAAAIFPAAEGVYVVGPTFQLTWIGFARLDFGVVFEFTTSSFNKILLMGSFQAEIRGTHPDKPLLGLRADFSGLIDFEHHDIAVDATLINSKALEVFHLTGDLAYRQHWGTGAYVLFSAGGFHPDFDPSPVVVPSLTRVALTQTPGLFGAGFYLRFEAYLAITSNSFQLGAGVEIGWRFGPLFAAGWIRFDALIYFKPFSFDVAFSAGLEIRWGSTTLVGVKVSGSIAGPGPTVLTGKACISLLFFDICAEGKKEIGSDDRPETEPVGRVTGELRAELDDPTNMHAIDGDDGMVKARETQPDLGEALVSAVGSLAWEQQRAPLDLLLERFEGVELATPQAVVATSPYEQGTTDGQFSAGRYLNLSKAEQLNQKTFQRMQNGLVLGFEARQAADVHHDVEVQTVKLPRRVPLLLAALTFPDILLAGVSARTAPAVATGVGAAVTVGDETWTVRAGDGSAVSTGRTEADAHQRARYAGDGAVAVPDGDLVDLGAW